MSEERKIFVLDTSVIIFDHNSILNFAEHDVAIPITVLEELDDFKKGSSVKSYEARQFTRMADGFTGENSLQSWIPLPGEGKGRFKILMNKNGDHIDAEKVYITDKMDHRILNAALYLQEVEPAKQVVLVTKDINLRLKAKALNLHAEDYQTGKVKNIDNLLTGIHQIIDLPQARLQLIHKQGYIDLEALPEANPINNNFYILKSNNSSVLACYNPSEKLFKKVEKRASYGIKPRNAEQTFALHAILNPGIKLVALQGVAGTGKTLLALAGALEQRRAFKQIYLARPIISLSNKDIGYLPGDIKSKIDPYMQPLWDNLKFIQQQYAEGDKAFKQISLMVETDKLLVVPLAYIRGRSLSDVIFIVDEAQNLTPHEVKTIITRAGENTKLIFTGDAKQIDTPYLDEESNGLSYLVDRLKGHALFAHIRLERGERSALANLANALL